MTSEQIWIAIGLMGQLLFSWRFILQWIVSEKNKRSVIPIGFWYLRIGGSLILLSYAIQPVERFMVTKPRPVSPESSTGQAMYRIYGVSILIQVLNTFYTS